MKNIFLFILMFSWFSVLSQDIVLPKYVLGAFTLADSISTASIYVDVHEEALIKRTASIFAEDIERVTGKKPEVVNRISPGKNVIIIGKIGFSPIIKQLTYNGKINISSLKGKWENYLIQVVNHPMKGIDKALVIVGSDRRGTAFGVFEMSKQIGVSPWFWWADVPVKQHQKIYLKPGAKIFDGPKVKYRGIFINDEAPALSNWSKEKFGGFNHVFYEKVFELILRLKANYLWPAMWGNAFYDDDSLNRKYAHEYGIVIGTSHHEPLMRAHDEWRRYGSGPWDYDSNETRLKEFWKTGLQRASNEKIVSIGMRGDGDKPMSRETATALLERIVTDQRKIIQDVTKKPASQTPQLWALYKEVQDYYDKGMRVPDDVTLLLCDDNWGNIRKLPHPSAPLRKGGYGIYYHFDYVGGPRNYKWINTNNLSRVWEQMHLAYEHGVNRIWIVNVGDIKPMELPISFFLDYAWNPTKWNENNLTTYYYKWAEQQFDSVNAIRIGNVLHSYSQLAARKKPELLSAETYSVYNYDEAAQVSASWKSLLREAEKTGSSLPAPFQNAYFQLVMHPVKAMCNLHEMYMAQALNQRYASKKNNRANYYANEVARLFHEDEKISSSYHEIAGGKWNHMMDQTHIGYTNWQQPPENKMPVVMYVTDTVQHDVELTEKKEINQNIPPYSAVSMGIKDVSLFYEEDGYVSINAAHWTRENSTTTIKWKVIPDIGRNGDGVSTFPVTASCKAFSNFSPP
jgi:hypothetical protein